MATSVRDRIAEIIMGAVEEVNEQLPAGERLQVSRDTVLFDESQGGAGLDSLGLVNLIVATEQRLEDELGVALSLTDDWEATQAKDPFKSIDALAEYITSLVETGTND